MLCSSRLPDGTFHQTVSGTVQPPLLASKHLFRAGNPFWVWISQDQSTHHSFLQLMKCIPGGFTKDHLLFLLFCSVTFCILMQEICDLGGVLNKVPVVPNKADETLNGSICGGFKVFGDGLQVIPAWPYPFQGDTMPQVLNCFL